MTNSLRTNEGMPRVSQEVVDVFFRDYSRWKIEGREGEFCTEMAEKISKENPELKKYFKVVYNSGISQEQMDAFAMGSSCMYEILRRQAESSKLKGVD